jgi:hypothetical protein
VPSHPTRHSASPKRSATGATHGPGRSSVHAGDTQFDLWPQRVQVEALDVRSVVGTHTRVTALFKVRFEREPGIHQVFFDHHGWYCADHGPSCKAVREVTARHAAPHAP